MEFHIDFSKISWVEASRIDVSIEEVYSVFNNPRSDSFLALFEIMVGLSNRRKFLVIAYQIAKNANFDVEVIQIDLPHEEDIEQVWCSHK